MSLQVPDVVSSSIMPGCSESSILGAEHHHTQKHRSSCISSCRCKVNLENVGSLTRYSKQEDTCVPGSLRVYLSKQMWRQIKCYIGVIDVCITEVFQVRSSDKNQIRLSNSICSSPVSLKVNVGQCLQQLGLVHTALPVH